MQRVPAPFLRGLTVLAIGAALAMSHAAFAAPGANIATSLEKVQVGLAQTIDADRQLTATVPMHENCYFETQMERTARGKIVSRLVQECD